MIERSVGRAEIRFSGVAEGDLGHNGVWVPVDGIDPVVAVRRAALHPGPWTWLRQVHGARVVIVEAPGGGAGQEADAAVTAVPGAPLAVFTADCAPVALAGDATLGVAHAGWRGLVAGVLPRTVEAMRALGERGTIRAVLGPCIHAPCYEFGAAELDDVAGVLGDGVRAVSRSGSPALDVTAGARSSLAAAGVTDVDDVNVCTACGGGHWSFRARGEMERQAVVAWIS